MVLDFGTEAIKLLSGRGRFLQYLDDEEQEDYSKAIELVFRWFEKKAEKVILTLPPNVLKARIVSIVFKRPRPAKPITEKEEKAITDFVLQKAKKDVSGNFSALSGILPGDVRFVSLKILDRGIKIDGYQVPRLEGYDGRILEFSILTLFTPGFTNIERILRQERVEFKVVHEAEGLMILIADYPDGIFLDVGGQTTQIFLTRAGKLETTSEFGVGGKIFTQTISERLGLRTEDARIFKERYSNKELSHESSNRLREIFYFPQRAWFENLKMKLREVKSSPLFPSNIFLFGGGCLLPEIKEILERSNWENIAFLDAKPKVKILDDPQFFSALLLKSYGQKSY